MISMFTPGLPKNRHPATAGPPISMIGETMIGSTVGHYDIVRKIGSGGMGVVYLARDTRLDRHVALKFVRTPSDPGGARQLLREARAASALNHPGTVHEVGESGRIAYIVMEYIEGETLSDRMARGLSRPTM